MSWTTCGLCGARTAYVGSHVINVHLPYAPGQDAIVAKLREELTARTARDHAPLPYQSPFTRRAVAGLLPPKVTR